MGAPTSEVGYTPAVPRREDHEVHKGHVVALGGRGHNIELYHCQLTKNYEGRSNENLKI